MIKIYEEISHRNQKLVEGNKNNNCKLFLIFRNCPPLSKKLCKTNRRLVGRSLLQSGWQQEKNKHIIHKNLFVQEHQIQIQIKLQYPQPSA